MAAEPIRSPAPRTHLTVVDAGAGSSEDGTPLGGFRVVDLSTWIGGAYCTKLLADGGADVIKVESPDGDPLRRWSASGAAIPPGDDGALFNFLGASKQSVVVDVGRSDDLASLHALLASANAVVWTRGSPIAEHPSLTPGEIRARAPASDRHLDHSVRARRSLERQGGHRVHPASLVGRGRWAGAGKAGPRPGVRRWPDRGVACRPLWRHRHARGGPTLRLGRGARRRLHARVLGDVPHLLPGDVQRSARTADAAEALRRDPRRRGGPRRPRRARMRHRAAVARFLRPGRTPGVDGGPVPLPRPHGTDADDRRLDRRPHGRRGARPGVGLPDPQRTDHEWLQRHDVSALPRTRDLLDQSPGRRSQSPAPFSNDCRAASTAGLGPSSRWRFHRCGSAA